jgi:Protein of unknown function (DUF3071)
MQDLQLIGVHEDGEHLLLSGAGDARFRMPVDEALRTAIRPDRLRLGQPETDVKAELRPRDVQALIRAGASAEEAAGRAGWPVEKVHRYEGPILAEREHVTGLARKARLRARGGASDGGSAPTLSARVSERLKGRGVDVTDADWDSWRAEGGPWTVVLTFAAGGRQRQASWSFDLADRTVSAVDDEARWLSEEVQAAEGPIPAPQLGPSSFRATSVYDVEAEGGLRPSAPIERQDDPLDLMTAMRKRSTARGRRTPRGHRGAAKAATTVARAGDQAPEQALPLQDLALDPQMLPPETVPPTPGAHPNSDPGGLLARPESGAVPALIEIFDEGIHLQDSPSHDTDQSPEPVQTPAGQAQPKAPATRPDREGAHKTGRPSVPAWDDIIFGSRPGAGRSS